MILDVDTLSGEISEKAEEGYCIDNAYHAGSEADKGEEVDAKEGISVPGSALNHGHDGMERHIILASASPRRKELLSRIYEEFETEVSRVDETLPDGIAAEDAAMYLSGLKAEDIYRRHKGSGVVVIGSDTVVILDDVIYGKPKNEGDAIRMLRELSGRVHEVITGVTVIYDIYEEKAGLGTARFSFTETARVEFYELDDEDISKYIATGEPFDKAGAYGIQGLGCLLIKGIRGDFYTIMGLPVSRLYRAFKLKGIAK